MSFLAKLSLARWIAGGKGKDRSDVGVDGAVYSGVGRPFVGDTWTGGGIEKILP